MKEYIKKASILIEALPYIQKFRNSVVVVKLGGTAIEKEELLREVLEDIAFMNVVGMKPLLIHGGGNSITKAMKEEGIEPKFVMGERMTCERAIAIVKRILNEEINPYLVDGLRKFGVSAEGVKGEEIVRVKKKMYKSNNGVVVDLGYVGEPERVDIDRIGSMLEEHVIPVVSPLGSDEKGITYNVNADLSAMAIAKAIKARKLVFLTDVPGILYDPNDETSLISTITMEEAVELIKRGVISGGMLPKVNAAIDALKAGINQIHFIDSRLEHALLLEIFTTKGVGTQIIAE